LKKLPGIGTKSAERLAMFIVNMEKEKAHELADSIKETVDSYTNCIVCNVLSENEICEFCGALNRDEHLLCVVENTQDVYLIEKMHEFNGKYFVLGNLLSPIDGIGPQQIYFSKLKELVKSAKIKEIILALNPSAEGESTINFIASQLENVEITRLSVGLPFGGDIEYTSSMTLSSAFKRRFSVTE